MIMVTGSSELRTELGRRFTGEVLLRRWNRQPGDRQRSGVVESLGMSNYRRDAAGHPARLSILADDSGAAEERKMGNRFLWNSGKACRFDQRAALSRVYQLDRRGRWSASAEAPAEPAPMIEKKVIEEMLRFGSWELLLVLWSACCRRHT